jgi:tetratricopeptide (TPR) repeat protein
MEKYEKIIELLDKEKLTKDEQNYLSEFVNSDKDATRLEAVYKSIKTNMPKIAHIDSEMIGDFILYENGELSEDAMIPLLADKIKLHLKNCLECGEEYESLKEEFDDVTNHIEKNILKDDKSYRTKSLLPAFAANNFSSFKYVFTIFVVFAVAYLGLFTFSSISTPDYNKNIFSGKEDGFYVTRGRTSFTFQKGLDAVQKESYDDAIKYFELDIEEHAHQGSIFYTHFITGLTYLKSAESSFIGMFQSFDKEKVNKAVTNLNLSVEKNISGNYDNLNLDAHYYLGRSYLLLEDFEKAKDQLTIVIESKGKFYNEAAELISTLEKN